MHKINPYAAPTVEVTTSPAFTSANSDKSVIWAWERLRVYYNATLVIAAAFIILLIVPDKFRDELFWINSVSMGISANVFFCMGPVAETYLTWLGMPEKLTRRLIFLIGLGFSLLLIFLYVSVDEFFPAQD